MLNVAEGRTIAKRWPSIGFAENKCTRSQGVKEMGCTVAEETEAIGGKAMNPKLWNVNEVAEFLGLAVGTVYHLLSQKRIPCVRINGRCVRFDPRQIEEWVAQRTEVPEVR